MAAYITVPRDLTRVKSKILFNLTKRQLLCFSAAAVEGFPIFLGVKNATANISLAALSMMLSMLPWFFLAMYERDGQPCEVLARNFIESKWLRPRIRPYQTENYYTLLMRQTRAEEEVKKIASLAAEGKKQIPAK